jgi:hypothetical protein
MPPRPVVAFVVAGWLATIGWLAHDKWLPWLRPADEPAFVVEMADEVAPEHFTWTIHRNNKRIGSAETRFAPRKDGTFEMTTRLRDVEVDLLTVAHVKIPIFAATRHVTREGELVALEAKTLLEVQSLRSHTKFDATIRGRTEGHQFVSECELDSGGEKSTRPSEPIKLVSKTALLPLLPGQKYPPLKPGQTWRATNIDPVTEAVECATRYVLTKELGFAPPASERPAELLARVMAETEEVSNHGSSNVCRVIVFEGGKMRTRIWVDVVDGRLVRHEANMSGEPIILQRE